MAWHIYFEEPLPFPFEISNPLSIAGGQNKTVTQAHYLGVVFSANLNTGMQPQEQNTDVTRFFEHTAKCQANNAWG